MKARIKSGLLGIIPMLALSGIGEAFGQSSSDGQIPKPAARRSAVSFGKPAPVVSLQKPKPIYSNKPETQNSEDTLDGLQWLPKMIVRGAMPDGGGDGQTVSLYGPPPVPPPTESANPFPPAGGPPGGPPGPPPPTVGAPISDVPVAPSGNSNWWNKTCDWFKNSCSPHSDSKGGLFHSDCAYEGMFVTPISNPFLTEDPRSLTEIRPLYIYQTIPTKNNSFEGGSADFYGLQGRLAFNESWSLVINKLGWVTLDPKHTYGNYNGSTGFAEMWLGPKWTFFRAPNSGTAIAAGLTFQLPVGSSKVAQNTGTLGLVPYISSAQNIKAGSWGSFNFMNTTGIDFGINGRSDFFYTSLHLDYDVLNSHVFYPLVELNYYNYFANGSKMNQSFEGTDLFNFGSQNISGRNILTLATGMRYKYTEHIQFGTAIDFLLTSPRDVQDVRLIFDLIFRY